jgi:hypothetical protein
MPSILTRITADCVAEKKRRQVIEWLPSISFRTEQEDTYTRRIEGTGQWLLDNDVFQNWKTKSTSELLWVHGKHGCGKSYLAARVIQDLFETTERANELKRDGKNVAALAYIYCTSLDTTKIDPSKLMGSILNQLCHCLPNPEIDKSLENLFDRQSEAPTRQDMQRAIISITARFSETFVVVDGLDECHKLGDDHFEELCEFVNSLAEPKTMNCVVKVIVFSRPEYWEIRNAFDECTKIQVDAGANDVDIKQFIAKKVSGKDLHVRKTRGLPEEVEGTLLSGAEGMFLWVDLLVKTLRGQRTAKEIRAKLIQLPQGLDKLYELSMRRVLDQDEFVSARALKILLWTVNAKRALSQTELLEALAIQSDMTELDDNNENKIHDDIGFAAECGDLVVLVDGHYHLLHSSLKDYLETLPICGSTPVEEYRLMQRDGARILAETCLTYLKFDRFKKGPVDNVQALANLLGENPFLQYAARYWGCHVAEANASDLTDLMKSFLFLDGARELSMQIFMQQLDQTVCPYPGKTTSLHLLSIFNLVNIAKELPDAHLMNHERDGFGFVPIDHAFLSMSKEMSSWLLESTTDAGVARDPIYFDGALHRAALNDWDDIVRRLLSLGYNPEAKAGRHRRTPLHLAAAQGYESALIALIEAKVDLNSFDTAGQNPVLDATAFNHSRVVTLLLEAGADVHVHSRNGRTPLHNVAKHGNFHNAKQLLQRGAEVDPRTEDLSTPLHVTAQYNSSEVLKLLISNGADIEGPGTGGHNALLLACYNGSSECLELLCKTGNGSYIDISLWLAKKLKNQDKK